MAEFEKAAKRTIPPPRVSRGVPCKLDPPRDALIATLCSLPAMAEDSNPDIGKKVANFTLNGFRGQPYSLDDAGKGKIVVLAFLGTECPLCKSYASRLVELSDQYGAARRGVRGSRFQSAGRGNGDRLVCPSSQDRVSDSQGFESGDRRPGGATRTPEVVVLDAEHVVRVSRADRRPIRVRIRIPTIKSPPRTSEPGRRRSTNCWQAKA